MKGMQCWKNHGKIVIYHHGCNKIVIMKQTDGIKWVSIYGGGGTSYDSGIIGNQQQQQ
jgi:hypothetical protein